MRFHKKIEKEILFLKEFLENFQNFIQFSKLKLKEGLLI